MGWLKIKSASQYCDMGERSIRRWLKMGLVFSRLPSGTILISKDALDEFIGKYTVKDNEVARVVDEACKDLR